MALFLHHEHRNRTWDKIFLNTYQNEDKSHAIFLHLFNQNTEVLKVGAEGEVQLPVHVIYVYVLNVLQEGASRALGGLQPCAQGTHCSARLCVLLLADPSPLNLSHYSPRWASQFC